MLDNTAEQLKTFKSKYNQVWTLRLMRLMYFSSYFSWALEAPLLRQVGEREGELLARCVGEGKLRMTESFDECDSYDGATLESHSFNNIAI